MNNQQLRDKIAVASYEGILVNQHLGMAESLLIYDSDETGHHLVDRRTVPPKGGGEERWKQVSTILCDCHTLLVNGIGEVPCEILTAGGLTIYEIEGLIEDALSAIGRGEKLRMPRRTRVGCRRAETGEGGTGCD
jgi:nitrogen fixation protein NifB